MNDEDFTYGYGPLNRDKMSRWKSLSFWDDWDNFLKIEKSTDSYDFLKDYSSVYNLYSASTPQPNPFSNKAMFIIDKLTKMGVKYSLDIFTYEGNNILWGTNDNSTHKLVNIIAEPNPQATGPAILFVAHHDVANVHSQNCQDNGASVCNLLRLASLIKESKEENQRTIILFSDSEESGARGAKQFASKGQKNKENTSMIDHEIYGQISAVVNLELTGNGTVVWSDCEAKKAEIELHESLEKVFGKTIPKLNTPPSDAISFRKYGYPVLCIGILPEDDLKNKETWRLCHSLKDTIEGCDRKNMEDFTNFLFNLTKTTTIEDGNDNNGANQAEGTLRT